MKYLIQIVGKDKSYYLFTPFDQVCLRISLFLHGWNNKNDIFFSYLDIQLFERMCVNNLTLETMIKGKEKTSKISDRHYSRRNK